MHRIVTGVALFAILASAAPARAQLTAADLEGHWLSERYIAALESSESLIEAAKIAMPIEVSIEPFGQGHRMFVGNFHEATWNAIARVEQGDGDGCTIVVAPYETIVVPDTELRNVPATLVRDRNGRVETMEMAVWGEESVSFRRLETTGEQFVNATLFGGSWHDLDGGRWLFDPSGSLTRPDGSVAQFSASIDTSEACCDYLTIDGTRTGIALHDGTLWMYRELEDPEGCPISCDRTKPLRILVRELAGDRASLVALSRVTLSPHSKDGATWGGGARRVTISLPNPTRKPDPESFSEPPLTVSDGKAGTRCEIDGGNWIRDAIWLSADESLLVTVTFSGSGEELSVYGTNDCRRSASVSVAERTLRVDGNRIEHAGMCEPRGDDVFDCEPAAIWLLRPDGTLDHLADESARLTRGVIGAGFSVRSNIEHARTDNARIKRDAP